MVEQMLSWHALDLQIESRSMGIRLSDPARMPTLTSRHWQCKIQGVPLFSVGSTPTWCRLQVYPSGSAYAVFPLMVDEKLGIKKRNLGYSTRRRTAKVCRF